MDRGHGACSGADRDDVVGLKPQASAALKKSCTVSAIRLPSSEGGSGATSRPIVEPVVQRFYECPDPPPTPP